MPQGAYTPLRAAGIEVWFDQGELRGGNAWDAAIRKQVRDCCAHGTADCLLGRLAARL
jgi:hypothetical protein